MLEFFCPFVGCEGLSALWSVFSLPIFLFLFCFLSATLLLVRKYIIIRNAVGSNRVTVFNVKVAAKV